MAGKRLATIVAALAALAAPALAAGPRPHVLPGIEVLQGPEGDRPVLGQRIGLVVNASAVDSRGVSDIDRLFHDHRTHLVELFAPEHGIRANITVDHVDNTRDQTTGLPIYSLYGTHKAPTPGELAGIDTLVFDLQDVGARFYTYTSTMALCMQACAAAHKRFVVLDRPDPIRGVPGGDVLDPHFASFVGEYPIPIRHGLTIGELARVFNGAFGIHCDLTVVPMKGWHRDMWFDQTGLPWVDPSPAMRDLYAATTYPGLCFFEATNVSCRAKDRPFHWVGAPWIDGKALADALNARHLPGVVFHEARGTALIDDRWQDCDGVDVVVRDRDRYAPVLTGLVMVAEVHRLYPDRLHFEARGFDQLAGNATLLAAIRQGEDPRALEAKWRAEVAAFERMARPYLLYR